MRKNTEPTKAQPTKAQPTNAQPTKAEQRYADAYHAHYSDRDLPSALRLYTHLIETYPKAREADYARRQIENMADAVVPKQALSEGKTELALARMCLDSPIERDSTRVASLASRLLAPASAVVR